MPSAPSNKTSRRIALDGGWAILSVQPIIPDPELKGHTSVLAVAFDFCRAIKTVNNSVFSPRFADSHISFVGADDLHGIDFGLFGSTFAR
jgi:hypothetical protein